MFLRSVIVLCGMSIIASSSHAMNGFCQTPSTRKSSMVKYQQHMYMSRMVEGVRSADTCMWIKRACVDGETYLRKELERYLRTSSEKRLKKQTSCIFAYVCQMLGALNAKGAVPTSFDFDLYYAIDFDQISYYKAATLLVLGKVLRILSGTYQNLSNATLVVLLAAYQKNDFDPLQGNPSGSAAKELAELYTASGNYIQAQKYLSGSIQSFIQDNPPASPDFDFSDSEEAVSDDSTDTIVLDGDLDFGNEGKTSND